VQANPLSFVLSSSEFLRSLPSSPLWRPIYIISILNSLFFFFRRRSFVFARVLELVVAIVNDTNLQQE
jgi:hypothetical protein